MADIVSWNGVNYSVPVEGEENWAGATKVDGLLKSLATNGFNKAGGNFTLSTDVDFGGTAGLKSLYFKSRSSNIATAGILRLANAEVIAWRNAGLSGNNTLTSDSSDRLVYNGTVIFSSTGVVPVTAGGTNISSYTAGDILYASGTTTLSKLGIGAANTVQVSTGSAPSWALITNSNIDASAAIARSKVATSTAYRIVANDASGALGVNAALTNHRIIVADTNGQLANNAALTAGHVIYADSNGELAGEAALLATRGGTGFGSFTVGAILYADTTTTLARLNPSTSGKFLRDNGVGVAPSYETPVITFTYKAKTHADTGYTILSTDDVVVWTLTNASDDTFTFPSASTFGVRRLIIKLTNTTASFNKLTGTRAGSDTITFQDGTASQTSIVLYTQGETYEFYSDGSSVWQVVAHHTITPWVSYTPTYVGIGTATNGTVYWKRIGEEMHLRGGFTAGTPTAVAFKMSLPSGTTMDTSKIAYIGSVAVMATINLGTGSGSGMYVDTVGGALIADSGDSGNFYLAYRVANSTAVIQAEINGSTAFSSGNCSQFHGLSVPITGWKA